MSHSNFRSMFTKSIIGMVKGYGKINVLLQLYTDISLREKHIINDLV